MFDIRRNGLWGTICHIIDKIKIPHAWIQKLIVTYIIVWSISPPLQVDMIYRLLVLGSVALFFFLTITEHKRLHKIHIWALLFAVAVVVIAYIQYNGFSGVLKPMGIYMLIICFIINYLYEGRWQELSGVVLLVFALLTIWNFKTVQALMQDPTIARLIVRNDVDTFQYLKDGVGGYGLIYPQVCIFPALLAWILKAFKYNKVCFLLGSVWLVSYVFLLLEAGYSIAIFATAVGAIILLFHKGKNVAGSFFLTVLIFVGVLAMIVFVDGFRNMLLNVFEGTAVTKKINDLMSTSETGNVEGSIWIRMHLYGISITTIFTYPVIGGLWFHGGGGHSAVLDAFAKYGLWGGYLYVKMLYHVPRTYKRKIDHPLICSISNATMITLIFVSVLDTFSYSFMSVVLIVLPLLYEDIIRWEKIQT